MITDTARANIFGLTNSGKGVYPYVKRFSQFSYMLNIHNGNEGNSIANTSVVDCNQYSCSKMYTLRGFSDDTLVTTYIAFTDTSASLIAQHAITHFFETLFKYSVKLYVYDKIVYFSFPHKLFNGHWYMHNFLLKYLRLGLAYCSARGMTDIPSLPIFANHCFSFFGSIKPEARSLYEFFQYGDDGDQFLRLLNHYNVLIKIPFEKWNFNDTVFRTDDGMRASFMNYLELQSTNFYTEFKKHASTVASPKP